MSCVKSLFRKAYIMDIINLDGKAYITLADYETTEIFFKIGALTNFVIFTEKHLCWSLLLIKLQA